MSPDETKRLLAVASSLKARILLSLSYGCGLRAAEVVRLKVKHIDSTAMSCCRPRRSICCGNGGRRARRVTMPQRPSKNAGYFLAAVANFAFADMIAGAKEQSAASRRHIASDGRPYGGGDLLHDYSRSCDG
jgi:integrase